jgi:hypothetical protein
MDAATHMNSAPSANRLTGQILAEGNSPRIMADRPFNSGNEDLLDES